jgi:hypothetical protein
MKKLTLILTGLLLTAIINSQSLEEIVKSYTSAMKYDKLATISSIKMTGKVSAMGMELPMVMFMKNPNKVKMIYSFNGQDMISVFDGEKGYMINPMMGSSDPVELTGDELKQVQNNNAFKNDLMEYFNSGKLTLEGEENVNGNAAFKLKVIEGENPVFMFVDKSSYMIVKTSAKVNQMGNMTDVDSIMSDYTEVEGVVTPKKITQMANGMEAAVITFDSIEVNIPMDDNVFKIK